MDEYWIADWRQHQVEVYRQQNGQLPLIATLGPGDTLTSPRLPGFALPLDRLFAGIPLGTLGDEE